MKPYTTMTRWNWEVNQKKRARSIKSEHAFLMANYLAPLSISFKYIFFSPLGVVTLSKRISTYLSNVTVSV